MAVKLRVRLALWLIHQGRSLLGLSNEGIDPDWDTCVYCGAAGCGSGTAQHLADCPSETGIFPVTLQEMWPAGPARCEGCGATLWPGDTYSHIRLDLDSPLPVYQVACTGCALLAEIGAGD